MSSQTRIRKGYFAWMWGVLFFLVSSFISSAAMGYAWRDERFAWMGIIGLGVFLFAQLSYRKLFPVFAHGLLTGYLMFLFATPWMKWSIAGLIPASFGATSAIVHAVHLWHGGLWCLFAINWWFTRRFFRAGWLLAPAIWLILESFYPATFPMRQGCLLINVKPLIQIASVFGVVGVTLQTFLLASLLPLGWFAFKKSVETTIASGNKPGTGPIHSLVARRCLAAILLLTAANFAWGTTRIHQFETAERQFQGDRLEAMVLQGETKNAGSHSDMVQRSREHADDCDLILWPECSLGLYDRTLTDFSDDDEIAMKSLGICTSFRPLPDPNCYLLGAGCSYTQKNPDSEKVDSKFVSAYLLDPNEQMIGRHDKIKLMAGGEYTPGVEWFPALAQWLIPDEDEDVYDPGGIALSRGGSPAPIGEIRNVSIGVVICCEDMYPWLSRDLTNKGADLLASLANGTSFKSKIPLKQHYAISHFRAIETNRYFLRCSSHGVSGLISPIGNLSHTAPCFEAVDLRLSVPIKDRRTTLYCRFGDTLTTASYFLMLGLGIFSSLSAMADRRSNCRST